MIRPSRPRTSGRTRRGTSAVAGRDVEGDRAGRGSRRSCSVRAKSCIIGLPWTLIVDAAPDPAGGVEHRVVDAVAAQPAVGHRVQLAGRRGPRAGGRCSRPAGTLRRVPSKSQGRRCRARGSARTAASRPRRARGCGRRARARWCWPRSRPAGRAARPARRARRRPRRSGPSGCGTTAPARRGGGRRAPCRRRGTSGSARPGRRSGWGRCAGSGRRGGRAASPVTAEVGRGQLLGDRSEVVLQVAVAPWRAVPRDGHGGSG